MMVSYGIFINLLKINNYQCNEYMLQSIRVDCVKLFWGKFISIK